MNRIEFDATLEEVADVNMRLVRNTKAFRRSRAQYRWAAGAVIAGVLAVTLQDRVSTFSLVALGAISGFLAAYLYGRWYERSLSRSYMRMISELYGGAPTVRCAFESRDHMLWTKVGSTEMSFPWSDRVAVNDVGDSIEVWFNPGLAVVRNRAFRTDADRRAFLDAVRSRS